MKSRVLALLLAFVLILTALPAGVLAAGSSFGFDYFKTVIQEAAQYQQEWYFDPAHVDAGSSITGPSEFGVGTYDLVDEFGITTNEILRAMSHNYFSYRQIKAFEDSPSWNYIEYNGGLYLMRPMGLGGDWPEKVYLTYEKISDQEYLLTFDMFVYGENRQEKIRYILEDGQWVFDGSLLMEFGAEILNAMPVDETGSLSNFRRIHTYTPGQFRDVLPGAWYAENVADAYEYGLVLGYGDGVFGVNTDISIAQVIAIADRLHNQYFGGSGVFIQGQPWYQVYLDYAAEHGIISAGQYDPLAVATRAQFAAILSAALPDLALSPINHVTALPDVAPDAPYLPAVLRLYNAGILTGSDDYGTFEPERPIGREQVAAMATRVANVSLRKSVSFTNWTHIGDGMQLVKSGDTAVLSTRWFQLSLPGDIAWTCEESEDGMSLSFYYDRAHDAPDLYDGRFLTIRAFDHNDQEYEYYPQYTVAKKDRFKTYVFLFPSDVRIDANDPVQILEYSELLQWAYQIPEADSQTPFVVFYP